LPAARYAEAYAGIDEAIGRNIIKDSNYEAKLKALEGYFSKQTIQKNEFYMSSVKPVTNEIRTTATGLKYTEFINTVGETIGRTKTSSEIISVEGKFTSVAANTDIAKKFIKLYPQGAKQADLQLTTILKTDASGKIISSEPILALRSNAKGNAGHLIELGKLPKDPKLVEQLLKDHGVTVVSTGKIVTKRGVRTIEFVSSKGNFYISEDGAIFK